MDLIDLFFRLVGVFHVFAGYVGARAMLRSMLADKMLAAIAGEPEAAKEHLRGALLGCAAIVTGASGMALALMSFWALPLFLLNFVLQAIWLFRAGTAFAPEDAEDTGRQLRTMNAAVLYAFAALAVFWLSLDGRLGAWDDRVAVTLITATALYLGAWIAGDLWWAPGAHWALTPFDDCDDSQTAPNRIVVDPAFGRLPLVDADTGQRFSHHRWLPRALAMRVEAWDDAFQSSFDPDDPLAPNRFEPSGSDARYDTEAIEVLRELQKAFGEGNVSLGEGWRSGG